MITPHLVVAERVRSFRLAGILGMVIAISGLMAVDARAGSHPHVRQGWLVGFGIGGGSAGLTSDGESNDREGGAAGSFRAGYAFDPRLSLELNSSLWTKEVDDVTWTFSVGTAAVNFYPGAEGLVLRGGLGVGNAEAEVQSGSTTVSVEESGFGLGAGIGYEFRVTRTFALGPQFDFGWMNLDEADVNYFNVGLGFNWYFIPK